jgi:hypothetical protein
LSIPQGVKLGEELTKGCKDDLSRAKRLYEFVCRDIRYVAVEYGQSGYEPHQANDILLNRYGDCKDKATLLTAMMRQAGLKAYPVLIPTRDVYAISKDFPEVNFNHAIAAVELEGKFIFMDGTTVTTSFGDLPVDDQERDVLVCRDDGYKIEKTPLLSDNRIVYNTRMEIDQQENAKVFRQVIASGFNAAAQRYYLKYSHPQAIRDNIKNKMVAFSPLAELIDYKIENLDDWDKEPVLEYNFNAKAVLNPAGDLRTVQFMGDINIDASLVAKENLRFPIEFDGISQTISKVNLVLPPDLKINYLPENKNINTDWFDFTAAYKQVPAGVEFSREFSVKKMDVSKEEYPEFKKSLEKVFYLLREEIILEKTKSKVSKLKN